MVKSMKNGENSCPPIFIIGLPRSGSTLLSKIINKSPDIVSLNDLYYIQAVFAQKATEGLLTNDSAENLTDFMLDVISTRSHMNTNFIGQISVRKDQIEIIRRTILRQHQIKPYTWYELMDAVLSCVTRALNKHRWADKTPQNFMHTDLLSNAFPGAKFIFMFRNPVDTLNSLKHATGEGHDPRRYHPIAYAIYWCTAVRKYRSLQNLLDILIIRYEDILNDWGNTINRLNRYLSTQIPMIDLAILGNNSSFSSKVASNSLTATEIWIIQRICAKEMHSLGYTERPVFPNFRETPHIIRLSVRFLWFQLKRMSLSVDGRARILKFANETIKIRSSQR